MDTITDNHGDMTGSLGCVMASRMVPEEAAPGLVGADHRSAIQSRINAYRESDGYAAVMRPSGASTLVTPITTCLTNAARR